MSRSSMSLRRLFVVAAALVLSVCGVAATAPPVQAAPLLPRISNIWGAYRFRMPVNPKLFAPSYWFEAWMPGSWDPQAYESHGYGGRVRVGLQLISEYSPDPYYDAGGQGPTVDVAGQSPLRKWVLARNDARSVAVKVYAQHGIRYRYGDGWSDIWYPGCTLKVWGKLVDHRDPSPAASAKLTDYAWCYGYFY
ncbi:hypothetical protein nbrc107696_23270 [Gordonia spumicola]|uniref:Uncharacterized protein n=1 Tax=Gordonia spumicola TaxID=589161 RepID=A0A7I9V9V6_9ACTN|nr:hypothetical protein [Gordonia spumicola]GEE01881.1 hypothetical protein nbrc107696_23270 [Gordonia spumicola]